jgi:hypothetical protein
MRLPLLLAAFAALALPASAEAPPAQTHAEAVAAAERAFAAAAHDKGIAAAFLESMDQEHAIRLTPEPKPALAYWQAQKNRVGPPYLVWRPTWAGASKCGDLGFDSGPYSAGDKYFGYFFTIWGRRAPDAPFKWLLDFGVERDGDPRIAADAPVVFADPASGKWPLYYPESAEGRYKAEIGKADLALDAALAHAPKPAFALRLADDARAMGIGLSDPAVGKAAVLEAVAARPPIQARPLGAFVSACGDLAASYGSADWTSADGKTAKGDYVRIWRRKGPRWTLLFDEVAPPL